jgi:uncharacterized protein
MFWKTEWKKIFLITLFFLFFFYLPVGSSRFDNAILESLFLIKWYVREHVVSCLIPAFFIAGAISVFVSQAAVIKYLGSQANKFVAYGVAAISGTILAVCSCTVLPLFAGIYRRGAGLGPAIAFLYSGPAINVLAIIFTARILGLELGIARAVGAICFSVIIGFIMHLLFRKEEENKASVTQAIPEEKTKRTLGQNALYFGLMIAVLVFANWGAPESPGGIWSIIYDLKWYITSLFSLALGIVLLLWFDVKIWKVLISVFAVTVTAIMVPETPSIPFVVGLLALSTVTSTTKGETTEWFASSWDFAKQIIPLLFGGILISGLLLGRVGHEGVIPSEWISVAVGGNSLMANFSAAFVGAFMYFATLTEVPILQGLIANGMGKGPALSLLLAGPALSLPNMLVIRGVLGTKKTLVFVSLVIVMATISGMIFGNLC